MREANILILDDEPMVIKSIRSFLELETDYKLHASTSPFDALKLLERHDVDVIITDYLMPEMNGIEFLLEVKKKNIESTLIILTGYGDKKNAIKAINEVGIYQYIEKPWDNEGLLIVINNAIERVNLLAEIQQKYVEIRKAYLGTIYRLATASEMFDEDTYSHVLRISFFSQKLAALSGEDSEFCYNIKYASMMHDVGKIGIPKELLTKQGALNAEEFEVIKSHSTIGGIILKNPDNQLLEMANKIALYHHEMWDGQGYPEGLVGEEITKAARIVAVADVFDALMSKRTYKPPLSQEKVRKIIEEKKGNHLDHEIAASLLENFDTFVKIFKEVSSMESEDISNNLFQSTL